MEVRLDLLRAMTPRERLVAMRRRCAYASPHATLPREQMIQVYGITAPSENALDDLRFGGQQVDIAYIRRMTERFDQLLRE